MATNCAAFRMPGSTWRYRSRWLRFRTDRPRSKYISCPWAAPSKQRPLGCVVRKLDHLVLTVHKRASRKLSGLATISRHCSGQLQVCPLFIHKGPFIAPNLATKICFDFCPARMSRPIGRCSPPKNVLQVQSCTAFDKEPDYFIVPSPGSLV